MPTALERAQSARQGVASGGTALERVMRARGAPAEPVASLTHRNVQPGDVLPLPGAVPSRPQMPRTGTTDEFGQNLQGIAQGAGELGGAAARTVGHNLLPAVVGQETPEQGRMFDDTMTQVAMTMAGGLIGRGIGSKASDIVKYLGRGFKTRPEASQFIASNPVRASMASGQGVSVGDLLGPTISGSAVGGAVDALDPTPYELTDKPVAGGAGLLTGAVVAKKTAEDLLLGNPRWQQVMTRPSAGTASGVLGALLGYMASQGLIAGRDQISNAVDWVAGLFNEDEAAQ